LDGRVPYKTMIKEEINIQPAPIEDKIYIPSSLSMMGLRPRLPRVVKIVMQEIVAKHKIPKSKRNPLAIDEAKAVRVRPIKIAPATEKNEIRPISTSSMLSVVSISSRLTSTLTPDSPLKISSGNGYGKSLLDSNSFKLALYI